MARTNYQYEKRQRDLAKKKKKEEKRLKKLNKAVEVDVENTEVVDEETGGVENDVEKTEEDV